MEELNAMVQTTGGSFRDQEDKIMLKPVGTGYW